MRIYLTARTPEGDPVRIPAGAYVAFPLEIGARALVVSLDKSSAPVGADDLLDPTSADLDARLSNQQISGLAGVIGVSANVLRSQLDPANPTFRQLLRWLMGGEANCPRQLQARYDSRPLTAEDVQGWLRQEKPIVTPSARMRRIT